jgi:Reverse transcriptase (RNA-dependent DNA polymerase)
MPFGTKLTPGVFQKMIYRAIKLLAYLNENAYLGDIVVCSKTRNEHAKTLEKLLKRLVKMKLHGLKKKSFYFTKMK